jgi:hypothetical protein
MAKYSMISILPGPVDNSKDEDFSVQALGLSNKTPRYTRIDMISYPSPVSFCFFLGWVIRW